MKFKFGDKVTFSQKAYDSGIPTSNWKHRCLTKTGTVVSKGYSHSKIIVYVIWDYYKAREGYHFSFLKTRKTGANE